MGAIVQLALSAFGATSLLTKLIIIGSLVAAAGVAYGAWYLHVYRAGYSAAIAAIARQDERAVRAAEAARSALRDCRSRGLRWDQSTGKCEGG